MTHQIVDATIEPTQDPSKRYRCRHIFIDGHRCGSPSLRGEHLCYYHHTSRGFAEEKRNRRTWTEFELPPLEDRSSILAAVTEVLQRIACDNLPVKQAGLLLYGLQIASNNLPEPDEAKAKSDNQPPVEQVLINPHYGDLAPIAEFVEEAKPATLPSLNAGAATTPTVSHDLETSRHSERSEEPPQSARSANPFSGKPFTPKPEINTPPPHPGSTACYPNNCHANEKRTSRPPHSAHRHQAAQRRRSRRRHAVDGLQLA